MMNHLTTHHHPTIMNFEAFILPSTISGEPYPGNVSCSIQSTNYVFDDINGDGRQDLLEATFVGKDQRVDGYPLPQCIHFFDDNAQVTDTLVVIDSDDGDAGRSVTTGQMFNNSELSDVVFASAKGVVALFANLGVDESTGQWNGL